MSNCSSRCLPSSSPVAEGLREKMAAILYIYIIYILGTRCWIYQSDCWKPRPLGRLLGRTAGKVTSGCAAAPKYTYVTVSPHQLVPLLLFFFFLPPLRNFWPSSERWRPPRISTSFTPSVPCVCVRACFFLFPPFSLCTTSLRYLGPRARSVFACKRRLADTGALLTSLPLPSVCLTVPQSQHSCCSAARAPAASLFVFSCPSPSVVSVRGFAASLTCAPQDVLRNDERRSGDDMRWRRLLCLLFIPGSLFCFSLLRHLVAREIPTVGAHISTGDICSAACPGSCPVTHTHTHMYAQYTHCPGKTHITSTHIPLPSHSHRHVNGIPCILPAGRSVSIQTANSP